MKNKVSFDPENYDRSHLLHEFLALFKTLSVNSNESSARQMLNFLSNKENSASIVSHAIFNPHPEKHSSVESDIECAILALSNWIEGDSDFKTSFIYLSDLKKWIINK